MSRPERAASAKMRSRTWLGHARELGHRMSLSPSFSGASGVPHEGHSVGIATKARSDPSREVDDGPHDLGDDVTGLAQHDGVADQHFLALDLVGVVQRRVLHGRSGDPGGSMTPYGVTRPVRPTLTPMDRSGVDLLGGELEGDGPARRPARRAQPALHRTSSTLTTTRRSRGHVCGGARRCSTRCALLDRRDDPPRRRSAAPRRAERRTTRTARRARSPRARRARGRACPAAARR